LEGSVTYRKVPGYVVNVLQEGGRKGGEQFLTSKGEGSKRNAKTTNTMIE